MKSLLKQLLSLGGFYFIISFFFGIFENSIMDIINILLFVILFVCISILAIKKRFIFLDMIEKKYPKFNLYLITFGIIEYLGLIIITIPAMVYGYNAAMAKYNNIQHISIIPNYLSYASILYWSVLAIGVVWVTYINFIKKREN